MSATYNGLIFKTELEATWAAFFDLAGWEWRTNPAPVDNWAPDFKVTFDCTHSECNGSHTLLVAVLPVRDLAFITGHPALSHAYGDGGCSPDVDSGAILGLHPRISTWEMAHGAGGGTESIPAWVHDCDELWNKALCLVDDIIP